MTYLTNMTVRHAPTDASEVEGFSSAQGDCQARSRYADLSIARLGMQARASRGRFFNSSLFADPAWDMLLELYAAWLTERKLSVSRLAERSGIPLTTALRWVASLEKEGLIEKSEKPFDRRQVLVSLSEGGQAAMAAFFESLEAETRLF